MEMYARAPDPLTKSANMAASWHSWKQDFLIFLKVTGYDKKPQDVKANLFKNRLGKLGIDAMQEFIFDHPEDMENLDVLLEKFDAYFDPPKNEVEERYKFFTRSMNNNEMITDHVNELRELAKHCNFGSLTESLIRDKLFLDIKDKMLRKRLLQENDLNVEKLLTIYHEHTVHAKDMKVIANTTSGNAGKKQPNAFNAHREKKGCWRCNTTHPKNHCPAWGHKCPKCGEYNHFALACSAHLSKKISPVHVQTSKVPEQKIGFPSTNNLKENESNEASSGFLQYLYNPLSFFTTTNTTTGENTTYIE